MRHFSSFTFDLKISRISVKYVANFQCFCDLSDFLSRCVHSSVWIHCRDRPNYDFCISQGSVERVILWGGLNYSHLRQVSSWCCMPKIMKIWLMFHGVIQKIKVARLFIETQCSWACGWVDFSSSSVSATKIET